MKKLLMLAFVSVFVLTCGVMFSACGEKQIIPNGVYTVTHVQVSGQLISIKSFEDDDSVLEDFLSRTSLGLDPTEQNKFFSSIKFRVNGLVEQGRNRKITISGNRIIYETLYDNEAYNTYSNKKIHSLENGYVMIKDGDNISRGAKYKDEKFFYDEDVYYFTESSGLIESDSTLLFQWVLTRQD